MSEELKAQLDGATEAFFEEYKTAISQGNKISFENLRKFGNHYLDSEYSGFCSGWNAKRRRTPDINTEMLLALKALMEGIDNLPPLTAIQGVLTEQWERCEKVIQEVEG